MAAEDYPAAQVRAEGELGSVLLEVLVPQLGRERFKSLRRVEADPGVTKSLVIDVCAVDLDPFRGFLDPRASEKAIASEYASSPLAQPALHTRISRAGSMSVSRSCMTSRCRKDHASASRKNPVTLIRIVLNRWPNSSVLLSSRSR